MSEKKSHRLFVALDLPDAAKVALTGLFRGIPNLRWQNSDGLHITLSFIGNVGEDVFLKLLDNLHTAPKPSNPVLVRLKGLGMFSRRGKTSILWAGVEKTTGLLTLQNHVASWLFQNIGLKLEDRIYTPHVTLAKPKKTPEKFISAYVEKNSDFSFPEFVAKDFALFSSRVTESGSIYTVEKTFSL